MRAGDPLAVGLYRQMDAINTVADESTLLQMITVVVVHAGDPLSVGDEPAWVLLLVKPTLTRTPDQVQILQICV